MIQAGDNKKPNDKKSGEEQFPGYPHYASKEDVFSKDNAGKQVDADLENITRKTHVSDKDLTPKSKTETDAAPVAGEDLGIVKGNEADVTEDDLLGLEAIDREMNDEDELDADSLDDLNDIDDVDAQESDWKKDKTGRDLDIPGQELDDEAEDVGAEDEENNGYSLGGDRQDSLEEDRDDDGN
ncbi:hypothetical protein GA0116948_102135 [Chitinophaga costaii]|uniref:Uncharacterized protein n=1 Tax=Chitinophaga costaii TaxID=1335309 RepID=A0A1C4AHV5_9BACT|nr:hypothetical protein [Chitinophaga costaii]PUZ26606.1 hypothetical protein DCM91_09355 [Chitinophaga costaii]SCB94081.1 hypothetical protein GA0116948_102135 [Chitinophaga costaii]